MATDQPSEAPNEQIAREAAQAYTALTEQAQDLPPDRAATILRVRDFFTGFAAYYAAMDRRLADQEQITDLFFGGDLTLLAGLLRSRLTDSQREELAHLITASEQ